MLNKKLIVFIVVLLFFVPLKLLFAQDGDATTNQTQDGTAQTPTSPTSLTNPLGTDSPEIVIANVINTIFGIVGSLALLMFVYGGLIWMTSSGNKESVDKGKNIIKWAAIGLVIIFSSYALVRFLITGVGAV